MIGLILLNGFCFHVGLCFHVVMCFIFLWFLFYDSFNFFCHLLVNVPLELIIPVLGVTPLSTVMLLALVQPDPDVMVTATVPCVVPVQSTVTDELVSEPEIVPLVTVQRKVCVPGSVTE